MLDASFGISHPIQPQLIRKCLLYSCDVCFKKLKKFFNTLFELLKKIVRIEIVMKQKFTSKYDEV